MKPIEKNFEEQVIAARMLTEVEGSKVLIVGISAGGADEGLLTRSVSAGTSKRHARIFIAGLEREIARIRMLIGEDA